LLVFAASLTNDLDGSHGGKSQHIAGKYNNDADDAAELGGVHHMSKVAALRMWWSGETSKGPHLNAVSNDEEQRLLGSLPWILALVGAGVLIMVLHPHRRASLYLRTFLMPA
jgi:hypothetical protein